MPELSESSDDESPCIHIPMLHYGHEGFGIIQGLALPIHLYEQVGEEPIVAVLAFKNAGMQAPPEGQSSVSVLKKEASSLLLANKRACVILLESLADVMKDRDELSEDLKRSAQRIADSWKSKINLQVDLTSNQAIEAQSLLQLLATFGLASEYDPDELCKLVIPITRRRQTPSLCRTLGLSSKVPGLSFVVTKHNLMLCF